MNTPCAEKTILLIDQNDQDVRLFGRAAKRSCSARVDRVTSGQEAIGYLIHQQSVPDGLPNLVIMEWNLPSGDAFALRRFVNGTTNLKAIPTIILTGIDSPEQIESVRDLGAEVGLFEANEPRRHAETRVRPLRSLYPLRHSAGAHRKGAGDRTLVA